ncbi:DUF1259 domain-containing protein [Terriglobus aquaticus]|jgi:hypothetical protein|nr:DUF1259 domain-containing protein [Terriglobus aquaticus]
MRNQIVYSVALCALACCLTSAWAQADPNAAWKPVDAALGRSGQMQPGDVYKFALPRRDMKVVKDGVTIAPGLALGSWIAFKKMGNEAMVMGDLVLADDEIEPVMLKLQQNGIEQTSIHNHLLGESPRVIYMHIAGHGDPVVLARSLASALALTKTPFPPATTPPAAAQPTIDLKTAEVEQALGYSGKVNGGILQFSVPRIEKISDNGMEVPPAMGTATAINFQPTGEGKAAIAGDFVLLTAEVNPVIRALRTHGIEVEAVHNHMLFDQPHLIFMHFWANDDAVKLAQGLRAALNETSSQKPQIK